MDQNLKNAIFERLKHSVQLLALSGDEQQRLLPSYVCKADELALEFDHWHEVAVHNYKAELQTNQLASLIALDEKLSWLTVNRNALWSDEALLSSPEWEQVRILALGVLDLFGWPAETPPSHAREYISADQIRKHTDN